MMLAYPDLSLFCELHRLTCSTTDALGITMLSGRSQKAKATEHRIPCT